MENEMIACTIPSSSLHVNSRDNRLILRKLCHASQIALRLLNDNLRVSDYRTMTFNHATFFRMETFAVITIEFTGNMVKLSIDLMWKNTI